MGTITRSHTFVAGEKPTDDQWNVDIDQTFTLINGNLDESNVDYSSSDGIVTLQQTQTITGTKTFDAATTFNTSILPDSAGGADMGSATQEWGDVYVADDKFIKFGSDQNVFVGYDETTTDSLKFAATEGAGLAITLMADEGDDAGDEWKLNVADGGTLTLGNDIASAGSYVTQLTLTPNSTVASSTTAIAGHATVGGNATVTGVLKTDSGTDATSTTDGSLQTDGGLSVVKDAIFGNDVKLLTDSSVLSLGVGSDATLTHDGTTGVTIAANPIIVDSGDALTLDAHTGIFIFKDAGSEVLRFTEGNSGDVTVKLATNGKDLVFTDNGDATNMKILDAAAGINVPGEVQTTKIAYTDGDDAITIADGGGVTTSGTLTIGTVAAAGTDTDKFLVLDSSGNVDYRTGSQVLSDIGAAGSGSGVAADDISAGDGAVSIETTSGNITIDAQANDADVIIKVDDNGSAVTALTLDGSDEGNAIFVNDVQLKSDGALLEFGADLDTTLTHTDGTGLTLNSTNKLTFGDAASFIQQSSDGTLRIDGEAIIDLNASTRVDVSGDLKVGGEVQTASIGYTDGDNAITIADGGGCTFAQDATFGDNTKVTLGTGGDADIYYDATDLIINPKVAGSGKLGIGNTTPTAHSNSSGTSVVIGTNSATDGISIITATDGYGRVAFGDGNGDPGEWEGYIQYFHGTNQMAFHTANTQHMAINGSGHVGIGCNPAGWLATFDALQIGGYGAISAAQQTDAGMPFQITHNANYDTDSSWEYIVTDEAAMYQMVGGEYMWYNAVSGTAGNDISFIERLRIDSSGNLRIVSTANAVGRLNFADPDDTDVGRIQYDHSSNSMEFYTAAAERMRLTSAGNLGIAMDTPSHKLDVTGTAGLSTGTAWTNTSDARIKKDVETITGATEKLKQLRPVSYKYTDQYLSVHDEIDGSKTYHSFVADEYANVFPDAVSVQGDLVKITPAVDEVQAQDEVLYVDGDTDIPDGKSVGDVRTLAVEAVEGRDAVRETLLTDLKQFTPHDLQMFLTAAIQELDARIAALESA